MTRKLYLYKKTHNQTGLKYLGTTVSKNPHNYKGSGKHWCRHIKKHGYDVDTEILLETDNEVELSKTGLYYSKLWNIVESKEWANLKPESGAGGGYVAGSEVAKQVASKLKGHPNWAPPATQQTKNKISKIQTDLLSKMTPEELSARMKNSCCHPNSYTPERIENMRKGMIGKKKTKTPKLLAAIEAKRERSIKNMLTAAEKNRGRTWKLIDGKRVWMDKEIQNY
jgi:hypothetical protein